MINILLPIMPVDLDMLPFTVLNILKNTTDQVCFYIVAPDFRFNTFADSITVLHKLDNMCKAYRNSTWALRRVSPDQMYQFNAMKMRSVFTYWSSEISLMKQECFSYLPESVDKVLVLTPLTLVRKNLDDLWNTPFPTGRTVGMVFDAGKPNTQIFLLDVKTVRDTSDTVNLSNPHPKDVFELPSYTSLSTQTFGLDETGKPYLNSLDIPEQLNMLLSDQALDQYKIFTFGSAGDYESGFSFLTSPLFTTLKASLQEEMETYNFISPDVVNFPEEEQEIRLKSNQALPLDQLQIWGNRIQLDQKASDYFMSEINSDRAQEFFKIESDMVLWVTYGGTNNIREFLEYYKKILPANTKAFFIFDRQIPNTAELQGLISAYFPTLFFQIPDWCFFLHNTVQRFVFRAIYPELMGKKKWNVFVDVDEFLPLPNGYKGLIELTKDLESLSIKQMSSYLVDVWELTDKNGMIDFYVAKPSPTDAQLVHWDDPNLDSDPDGWERSTTKKSFFIRNNGAPSRHRNPIRKRFMTVENECPDKITLSYGDEGVRYSEASHEPHSNYHCTQEFMLRYPVIHYKYRRREYQEAIKFRGRRLDTAENVATVVKAMGPNYLNAIASLRADTDGMGPYKILGSNNNQDVLDKFGDLLLPLSKVIDSTHHFSVKKLGPFFKDGKDSLFPLVHLDPLFPQ